MQTSRFEYLDIFRGIIIVLMILVNTQSSNGYPILQHAIWDGCTLADLVFPSFLFIVGITTTLSLKKYKSNVSLNSIYLTIFRRFVLLYLCGLFLNAYPFFSSFEHLRYYGVLQRIAWCYLAGALLFLKSDVQQQFLLFLLILFFYWFLMVKIPAPNSQLDFHRNWIEYVDHLLFYPKHLYGKWVDSEGLLSTLPAFANTLVGLMTGQLLIKEINPLHRFAKLLIIALILLSLGFLWSISYPLNKNLWSSSFVLWSSGFSVGIFSLCVLLFNSTKRQKWVFGFKVLGMNALAVFILHVIILKTLIFLKVNTNFGTTINLKEYILDHWFSYFYPQNALLCFGLCIVLACYLAGLMLYKNKIFLKL